MSVSLHGPAGHRAALPPMMQQHAPPVVHGPVGRRAVVDPPHDPPVPQLPQQTRSTGAGFSSLQQVLQGFVHRASQQARLAAMIARVPPTAAESSVASGGQLTPEQLDQLRTAVQAQSDDFQQQIWDDWRRAWDTAAAVWNR